MKQYLKFLLLVFCCLSFYQLQAVDVTTRNYVFEAGEVRTFSPGRIITTSTSSDRTIVDCVAHLGEDKVTFTAMKPGIASWIVNYQDSKGISHAINYVIEVIDIISIAIPNQLTLKIGETYKFTPSIQDSRMQAYLLEWMSMDETVASVDNDHKVPIYNNWGQITGYDYIRGGNLITHKPGSTTIICTHKGVSATCQLTIEPIHVSDICFDNNNYELNEFQSLQLSPNILPDEATNKELTWKSSNTSVAIVDNRGKVTALSAGVAAIIATAKDGSMVSGSYLLTVKPEDIQTHDITCKVDESIQFSTQVEHSYPFTLNLQPPSSNWKITTFTLNGENAKEQLVNGVFSINSVEYPMVLHVNYEYDGILQFYDLTTSVESVIDNTTIRLTREGSLLYISNIGIGSSINIYTINGQLIGSHTTSNSSISIDLAPNSYIIFIDDICFKIKI